MAITSPTSEVKKKRNFPKIGLPSGLSQGLKGLLRHGDTQVVLEVGDEWLKMAAVSVLGNRRMIQALAAEQVQGSSEVDISLKIAAFIRQNNLKPKKTFILHPSNNLTLRILSLPSTDPHEIKDIIDLQAVKQTPYSKEEITTGFRLIDTDPTGYSRVLLAISHRDVSSGYYRVAEMARLPAEQINISVEGIRSWFERYASQRQEFLSKITVLLDVDWNATEFLIFQGDKLVFNRSISVGVKHLRESSAQGDENFVREVQRSLEGGQTELKGETVASMVVTSMHAKVRDIIPTLSREFNLACEFQSNAAPFEGMIPVREAEKLPSQCSYAALLGFCFSVHPAQINLIPPQIITKKGLENQARDLAVLGTLLLALVTLVSVISFEKIYKKDQYLKMLQQEHESIRSEAEDVQRYVAKMRLASEQMNPDANFLDVLSDVADVLPPDIFLTSLQFNGTEHTLIIRGISQEMSSVFKLLSTLEGSEHLEAVKTRNVTKRKMDDKEVAEFEVSALVVKGKEKTLKNEPEAARAPQPS